MNRTRLLRPSLLLLAFSSCSCGAEPPKPPPTPAHVKSEPTPRAAPPVSRKPVVTKRSVVVLDRKAGTDVWTMNPDGTGSFVLDVVENGRGPHVEATFRFDERGTLSSFEAKGHHMMGTTVAETFVREGPRARWNSKEEHGEADVKGLAFFAPIASAPGMLGPLSLALLKNGGTMALLPGGEARIEKVGDITVKGPAGATRHLAAHAITGLELVPTYVWLDDEGSWFGSTSHWMSVVPEGWEAAIPALLKTQDDLGRARDRALAKLHTQRPPAAGLAFVHARVLDVDKGRWLPDRTVVVVKEKIAAVGPSSSVKPPEGAQVVDLAGKALLPGLWDMHGHLSDADGALDVASGVTTVRDVGNDPDLVDDFKKRWDEGEAIGPHVVRFGFIEGRNEKAASSKVTAETESEAKAAVEFFAKRGYEGIKIYNSVKPELVPILAKEAHARGMRVSGHIPVHMLANEAVRAGYDGIEHINMLFLNFFATHETDTRTTTRFLLVGENAAAFDLKSKPVTDFIALLREKKTVIDPTLGVFEELLLAQQGKITKGLEPLVARLPVQTARSYKLGGLPLEGKEELYRASFEKVLAMVRLLEKEGITLVAGTDSLAGLMLHYELALMVRAGITPAAALKMATLTPAKTLGVDAKTGSIEKGKIADMFVVDGDPLARIEDVSKVVSTLRGGVLFPSAPLYQAVGVRPMP